MLPNDILLRVFADPTQTVGLTVDGWELLLAQARKTDLTARLSYWIEDAGVMTEVPDRASTQLAAARVVAASRRRMLEWEVNRLHRVLTGAGRPMLLLKGAAYAVAGLPMARGRSPIDIDIMVPRDQLERTEQHLMKHGWEPSEVDSYNRRYYERWSHELPPLRHPERGTELDVHHTILPPLSRLRPDPDALWRAAVTLRDGSRALCPTHMALHVAVHLFQEGEIAGGLGGLVDFAELCRDFGAGPDFWRRLVPDAVELKLVRPLYYALHYASELLGTTVPDWVMAEASRVGRPPRPVRAAMDPMVPRALLPDLPQHRTLWWRIARLCLYIRSHWLRMPPLPLARHLLHKAWVRRFAVAS